MLNSLFIQNYRSLKEVKIDSLDRINLIAGKNNTGKSSILEAIAIYASRGGLNFIFQLLKNRGEYFRPDTNNLMVDVRVFSSLFTGRVMEFNPESAIITGDSGVSVSLGFAKYVTEKQANEDGESVLRMRVLSGDEIYDKSKKYKIGFTIGEKGPSHKLFLEEHFDSTAYIDMFVPDKFQFIGAGNIDMAVNGKLFDDIILTEKEGYVTDALRIIEPETERIAFVTEKDSGRRSAIIKLSDMTNVLPLQSMGDGINRIFAIVLALVNAENGFLLIDEFENGLHYSTQETLWKIIFKLAGDLNVQVFATTHSSDCIAGFEAVLNNPDNAVTGKLIRMYNRDNTIRQIEFSPGELKIATEQNMEIR
jgi:predicted ATPase